MAASRGPIPERSDMTVRRNLGEPITKIPVIGPVEVPELNLGTVHPLVADLYESIRDSAQARYYEPSDWQYARLVMWELNTHLMQTKPSAMYLTAINSMLTSLLLTEGDRRRVRIEVERNSSGGEQGKVLEAADLFKQALAKQATEPGSPGGD